jgi:hypothetical protein
VKWLEWFKEDERQEIDKAAFQEAIDVLDFSQTPYYGRLLTWLEEQAAQPLVVGDHLDMVRSAVRANTMREVRRHLLRSVEAALSIKQESEHA